MYVYPLDLHLSEKYLSNAVISSSVFTLMDTMQVLRPEELEDTLMSLDCISATSFAPATSSSAVAAVRSPMIMNTMLRRSMADPILATMTSLDFQISLSLSIISGSISNVRLTAILPLTICSRLCTTPMMLALTVDMGSSADTS